MTAGSAVPKAHRAVIGRRPAADPASTWVRRGDDANPPARGTTYTARLTLDVTPALRGRIKVIAFQRGITAADMLRELLEREFAEGRA